MDEPVIPPALFRPLFAVKRERVIEGEPGRPPDGLEDDIGGRSSVRHCGAPASGNGAADQMVRRERASQAAGAGRCRGLPSSCLRRQISGRPAGNLAARRRNVIVQPSTYGTDNRCALDALVAIGPTARAVAVVDTSVSDAELKRMNDLGVRGIRFNLAQGAFATTPEMLEPLSRRVNDLGWHIQINAPSAKIMEIKDILNRVPSPIVFDHLAHIPEPEGTAHPLFAAVLALIDKGNTWVKLSGAYADTKVGPPSYSDSSAVARAYVQKAPERLVCGSDWPHPSERDNKPDDAILFDLLLDWAPDARVRNRILVQNPEMLYGFPKST
jgi:D-galactarolactone isomerase